VRLKSLKKPANPLFKPVYTANPAPPTSAQSSATPVPRVVYWIGLTSLLTDISSEMVASILPVYMFTVLHLSALQVGFLDGLYQGGAALVRVAFAYWADKYQAAKRIAVIGYGISVLAKILLLVSAAGGMLFVLLSLLLDRLGKGVRTAPRDALIAQHTPEKSLNQAFGVHRSMDAAGALAGPFLATGVLLYWVNGYNMVFGISMVFGVLGLLCITLKVAQPSQKFAEPVTELSSSTIHESLTFKASMKMLLANKLYIRMCLIAALLSVFTISDGLLYLTVQQHTGMPNYAVTALFAGSATVFMLTAIGFGRVADRYNPMKLFIGAYCGLLLLYVLWIVWSSIYTDPSQAALSWENIAVAVTIVVLVGFFYGASEGILVAGLVKQLSPAVLTTGLALFTTVQGVVKIISSTLYGWLWQAFSTSGAIQLFTCGLTLCILGAVWLWRRHDF
jgi:MFS family permease